MPHNTKPIGQPFAAITTPLRIQRQRIKGWRLPPNTVCVSRPGRWGNMYVPAPAIREPTLSAPALSAADCARLYGKYLRHILEMPGHRSAEIVREALRTELRGRHLACWCKLCPAHAAGKPLGTACDRCAPCHADVLLEIVNGPLTCDPVNG